MLNSWVGDPRRCADLRIALAYHPWPQVDESALVEDSVTLAIQVRGKRRGEIAVARDASKEDILAAAKRVPNVARHLEGMEVIKEIVVPGRLVNLVVKPAS